MTRIKIDDDEVEEEARRLEKDKGGITTSYRDFMAEARQSLEEQTREEIQDQIDRLRGPSDPGKAEKAPAGVPQAIWDKMSQEDRDAFNRG